MSPALSRIRFGGPARPALTAAILLALAQAAPTAYGRAYLDSLDANARTEFAANWGLAAINAQYAYARGLTGAGSVIGIFDSGIGAAHPELAGRVQGFTAAARRADGNPCRSGNYFSGESACFHTHGTEPVVTYQDWNAKLSEEFMMQDLEALLSRGHFHTHGTHVGGTMIAARDGRGMHGVAPAATLASINIGTNGYRNMEAALGLPGGVKLGSESIPPAEAARQGLNRLLGAGARLVNHSWGVAEAPPDDAIIDAQAIKFSDLSEAMAEPSRRAGLLQVWAAGNYSAAPADLLATLPHYKPELEPYWLSVVSVSGDRLDEFSSRCGRSLHWCVAAPGKEIRSSTIGGQADAEPIRDEAGNVIGLRVAADQQPQFGEEALSGTSMAAPHVTASLALLMQRFPYLHNAGIRDVLLTTARDLGAPGVDDIFGWGMIDLRKAIEGPGQLRVDMTVNMDRPGGGTPVWSGPAWDDWRNAIGGSGRLIKQGPGWLRLSGNNRFGGATVDGGTLEFSGDNALSAAVAVNRGGALQVSGKLAGSALQINGGQAWISGEVSGADVQVRQGGRLRIDGKILGKVAVDGRSRLEGNGQTGPTRMAGTIAPGHSIGTLTIAGDYVQLPGSVYEAEVDPAGRSDLLQVQGSATLEGGTLRVIPTKAGARLGQRWRVLSAQSVGGRFNAVEGILPSPFLAMDARYSADAVHAQVARGLPLASAARSPNQRSVAAAVDGTADTHSLPQRLTQLQPAQLPAALDPLSGELHASLHSLLLQDSQWVRDTALARARDGQDAFSAQAADGAARGPWAAIYQGQRRLDGDGNADAARLSGSTALLGYDQAFGDGWQLGLFGGAGRSSAQGGSGRDRAEVRATHAGLHVGHLWAGLAARVGLANSWQDVRTRRQVPAAGTSGNAYAQARYDVTTSQWFTELGYFFQRPHGGLEPFVQYAGLRLRSDDAREQGGEAPLQVARAKQFVGLWTGGLRFGVDLAARGQVQRWLSLRGSIAYQRAHGDLTPVAQLQWQQGPGFTVWGVPLGKHSAVAALGVAARLSERSLLELDWRGAFASHTQDHGVSARFSLRF